MKLTGSPSHGAKIQFKIDPKQISFQVSKTAIPIWRRIFLLRYFCTLGEADSFTVSWSDYDLQNKKART